MSLYRKDCGKRVIRMDRSTQAAHQRAAASNPGAGMTPSSITPYSTVLKDGFFQVTCAKDLLFYNGDKFGDGKYAYTLGDVSNVSIVLYSEMVDKFDRDPMTHEVCFEFCRTIPDMAFFGLTHGRECYCMPYYKQLAGDSSLCDAVCEGDTTQMCGGMSKSSLFAMHECADTAENLLSAEASVSAAQEALHNVTTELVILAGEMQAKAETYQAALGAKGDPEAADLMQAAKVFAGSLEHSEAEAAKLLPLMTAASIDAKAMAGEDFTKFAEATKAEKQIHEMSELTVKAEETAESCQDLVQLASPDVQVSAISGDQYYPLMYFVDKDFVDVPSTCSGSLIKKPIVDRTFDECALACDAAVMECVGFSYYPAGLCFLFSKFTSVRYYTGCASTAFLQKKIHLSAAVGSNSTTISCAAKLSKFEGKTVAPDPSGKCEGCLLKADKADRCVD
jgi:hypothetical protein